MILLLGPNKPPFEYIASLQRLVQDNHTEPVNLILDQDFRNMDWEATLLDNRSNISDFLLRQLTLSDTLLLQGPPGTGKTHLIAEICAKLCNQKKSVLVTALTNRALLEIVEKPALKPMLDEQKLLKTNLSVDEARLFPDLREAKELVPQSGNLILSTFYITSSQASQTQGTPPFDYVIVDEASQALLAMLAGAKDLGRKNLWIGDVNQLPPVVTMNEDRIRNKGYACLVDGLKTVSDAALLPGFQLTKSWRLTKRGADYTGIFYRHSLMSQATTSGPQNIAADGMQYANYFHPDGGPTLIKTDLRVADRRPIPAIKLSLCLILSLLQTDKSLHISVLTYFIETTKALQKAIYQTIGYHKNLLIETVSRVQGLTTDVAIFVIPNSGYNRSLEKRLFNVATSRAKKFTIVVADKDICNNQMDNEVQEYLQTLDKDFAFYIPASDLNMIEANKNQYIIENQ